MSSAKLLIESITAEAKLVHSLKEFCRMTRSMKGDAFAAEVKGGSPLCDFLAADNFAAGKKLLIDEPSTLLDILVFIARKLHEATWNI